MLDRMSQVGLAHDRPVNEKALLTICVNVNYQNLLIIIPMHTRHYQERIR